MNKNNAWGVVLIVIIGVALILYGVYGIHKASKYEKTTARFDYSELVEHRGSNGHTSRSFTWFYYYYVNGEKYYVHADSKQIEEPKEKETTVKYDPKDPSKSIVNKDYGNYILIIVGVLFVMPAFIVNQAEDNLSSEDGARRGAKMAGFYVTSFACAGYLLLFMTVDFSLLAMFTVNLFPILIITIFLAVGIYLIKRAYDPNYEIDYEIKDGRKVTVIRKIGEEKTVSSNENGNLENRINDVINSENTKKAIYHSIIIKDIVYIVFAIIFFLILFVPEFLAILFVILGKIFGADSYSYNGEDVTVWQFIFSSITPFRLLLFAIVLIILIVRVVALVKHIRSHKDQ